MENDKYNWNIIVTRALPSAAVVGYVFYTVNNGFVKFIVLIIGSVAAGYWVMKRDKKKANVFTAAAVVVLVAVIISALKRFDFFRFF